MPSQITKRSVEPKSFAHSKWLPGTRGNPFDVILTTGDSINRIPGFVFFILLCFLAALPAWTNPGKALILLIYMLLDWLLIGCLPRTHHSYGPVKPVVLTLGLLRAIFGLLPLFPTFLLQTLGTLLILWGFYFEPMQLDVHEETLLTDKLSQQTSLKIIHVGDLHIERLTTREQKILDALEKIQPDLILFSGDILNLSYVHDPQAQEEASKFLCHLSAPLGVYAVTGSPPVDPPEVFAKMLEGTQIHWLNNQMKQLNIGPDTLCVTGLTCTHLPERDYATLQQMNNVADPSSFNILLYHSPDLAPLACQIGFDLQLSGHTHGGQVRLPLIGAIYAASLYGKLFESGRYLLQKMTLYVTRGLGMEGGIAPRVRLFCRPELIVWQLQGKRI